MDREGDRVRVAGAGLGEEGGDEEGVLSGGSGVGSGEVYGGEEELDVVFAEELRRGEDGLDERVQRRREGVFVAVSGRLVRR